MRSQLLPNNFLQPKTYAFSFGFSFLLLAGCGFKSSSPTSEVAEDQGKLVELNATNFQAEVEQAEGWVLVDFWAPWCGPCKTLNPVLRELSLELAGELKIGKVNVDHNEALAARFNVQSIPCLILFHNGKTIERAVGAVNKTQLLVWINAIKSRQN